jgi:hypothetical protein
MLSTSEDEVYTHAPCVGIEFGRIHTRIFNGMASRRRVYEKGHEEKWHKEFYHGQMETDGTLLHVSMQG